MRELTMNDINEIKLLNIQFYNLIKRLRKNNFIQSSKIAVMAYEKLLTEISLRLENKIN